jgi:hypothetical protein
MIVINWYYFTLSCNAITKTSLLHVLKSVPAITKIIGNLYTDNSNFIPPLINIKKYLSKIPFQFAGHRPWPENP